MAGRKNFLWKLTSQPRLFCRAKFYVARWRRGAEAPLSGAELACLTSVAEKSDAGVCPSTVSPNLVKFGLEVRDPEFVELFWRDGEAVNTVVCKTTIRRFESDSRLQKSNKFWDKTSMQGFDSPPCLS